MLSIVFLNLFVQFLAAHSGFASIVTLAPIRSITANETLNCKVANRAIVQACNKEKGPASAEPSIDGGLSH